ncbi:hypothetical protein FJT64_016163 [Amphibalanus amphitrite]|uniref:Uncharacterized protein n=1 Tax=Amphibalanus amphitrite TaxID=1232801 RepID=A0A6A4X783_AMPAM|nr:hypothetical protein FJT64_016163 [Amphibalanus amphitrite]
MMDSCKLSGQDVPVAKERVPELPPLSSSVLGMSSEPYVDRQETASRWKASDRTENGHRESEGAEKQSRAVQKEETRTPNGVSTSTVEEVTSEVTSKTLETSRLHQPVTEQLASKQFSKTIKPETEERRRAPPASSEGRGQSVGQPPSREENSSRAPTAPFISAGITATPYVDQQETVSRSQVSERTEAGQREAESEETRKQTVQHAVSRTPTGSSSTTVEEQSTRTVSQSKEESRARPSQQRREHIIPVRLSRFPARRPPLRETSADRRHSVAAWPGLDWGQPPSADWWLSSDWGRPVRPAGGQSAEGLRPAALWPELHPQQPAFHCPVVGGPQAAALAALYSPQPPAGAANST